MLEDRPHLHLETDSVQFGMLRVPVGRFRNPADIMQGEVAETVDLVRFPLVDGVLPVDLEKPFHHGRYLVYVIDIERDDADSHQIRDIVDAFILPSFELELAGQGFLRLHTALHGGHDNAGLGKHPLQLVRDDPGHLRINGQQSPVLFQQVLHVRVIDSHGHSV